MVVILVSFSSPVPPLPKIQDPPEWVDVYPGGGGASHHHTGDSLSHGGALADHDEAGASAAAAVPLHAVEVVCARRLELQGRGRATCLCEGLWGQRLLLGREMVSHKRRPEMWPIGSCIFSSIDLDLKWMIQSTSPTGFLCCCCSHRSPC